LDEGGNALRKSDPGFVDESKGDLSLASRSPLVDAGLFLTKTLAAGEGRLLPVADVAFFFEGAGVPEVSGDQIRLEGQRDVARVLVVDFTHGTLLLDRDLQWHEGQGVALYFEGDAPDMGAYERAIH
jgi:hypothetical protein